MCVQWFETVDQELEQNRKDLDHSLTNLRYEGKASLGKNLNMVLRQERSILKKVMECFDVEKHVIFPYLESHLPKLSSPIKILTLEQERLQRGLRSFAFSAWVLNTRKSDQHLHRLIEEVFETGHYFSQLLRDYIDLKKKNCLSSIKAELHSDEKEALFNKIETWIMEQGIHARN